MTRSTLATVALLVAVPLQGASQSDACASIAPTAPISEIGTFSNMRYTAEHAYGETVLIVLPPSEGKTAPADGEAVLVWRSGHCIFGLFESAQGLAGDTPIKFDGTLGPARVIGGLIHATQLDPTPPARTIMLTASAKDADLMHGSATYGAWREKWEPIVKRRGPKW